MKPFDIVPQLETRVYKPVGLSRLNIQTWVGDLCLNAHSFPAPPDKLRHTTATLQIFPNMLKVRVPSVQPPHLLNMKRSAVGLEFGGKMRKRFLDAFNAWHVPNENMFMLHLTYPNEYDEDWHTWKLHLKTFKTHLLRRFPKAEGWWKLELQRRGAPHYHMIIDLRQHCSVIRFRAWVDACWARIAHDLDQYGGKYACRVETIWSIRHARNYAAKYMGKRTYAPVNADGEVVDSSHMRDTMGRMWGRLGKPNCDMDAQQSIPFESVTWMRLKLAMELKKQGARGWKALVLTTNPGSFTVYGLGSVADDRFETAPTIYDRLLQEWMNLDGKLAAHLFALDEVMTGQNRYRGVAVGQNYKPSLRERVGRGGGIISQVNVWDMPDVS